MEQTIKIINRLFEDTEIIYKMSTEELRDVLQLVTIVVGDEIFGCSIRQKAYLVGCVAASASRLALKERWSMYWSLESISFTDELFDVCHEALEGLYASIYESVERVIPSELKKDNEKKNGPVVIVTSQFIAEGHAPTRRVLDYAYTISNMGFDVVIINDGGLNIEIYPYNKEPRKFNYIPEYEEKSTYTYKGKSFKFYQNPEIMLEPKNIANMLYNIKALNPCLVLNVGGSCVTSDLCRFFAKTAVIPCSTSIATSMSDYIVVCRNLRESDVPRLERGLDRQTVVESVFNYILPQNQQKQVYTREMLGIPESAWLLTTAGNRMDEELSEPFIEMIDKLVDCDNEIYYMVVGNVGQKEQWLSKVKNKEHFLFPGSLTDGSEAIKLANLYIQPKRKGGGRAAFEALYYGVPALIPAYGDSWDVCGPDFEVEDYEEMKDKIKVLKQDQEYYQSMAHSALQRAAVLEDMPGMFEKLFQSLEVELPEQISVQYSSIFPTAENELRKTIESQFKFLKANIYFMQKRLRELEWAEVFHSSTRGENWLKDVNLSPGRCALSYAALYVLYRTLDEIRPSSVLELGLGQSTRVISEYAKNFSTEHYIVEHDESWINFFLGKNEISDNTQMVHLEREDSVYSGRYVRSATPIKHYKGFKEALMGKKFDLIFVDGPQGSNEISRVDITEILPEALEKSFVIMVDDSERQGETRTIDLIGKILEANKISFRIGVYDDMKDTALIVSEDYEFLLSL